MKTLFIYGRGNAPLWQSLAKMNGELQELVTSKKPDITLVREWGAPESPLADLLHSVESLDLAPGTLLVVNGRVRSDRYNVGCVSAVGYYKNGVRGTAFFPKKLNGGTADPIENFRVPGLARRSRNNSQGSRFGETFQPYGVISQPIGRELRKYVPPGYSLEKPATLDLEIGDAQVNSWFPICCDTKPAPVPGDCPVVAYSSYGSDIRFVPPVGQKLLLHSDEGYFSIGLSETSFSFVPHVSQTEYLPEYCHGFSEHGEIETIAPGVSLATLYVNPLK
jgi:hypothetical protein